MKKFEQQYMIGDNIDDCNQEQLRNDFTALKTEYQDNHHGCTNDDLITDPRSFFWIR
jgi:hypothetical protein